jgi:hypothetical protein
MGEVEALLNKIPKDEFRTFIELLPKSQKKMLDSEKNELIFQKLKASLKAVIDNKPNYDHSLKEAIGCPAECDFCGARC